MDTTVNISNEALLRLIKQIDARPDPARLGHADPEQLAQRLRSIPTTSGLRRRILVK
jgi:hypothetical protein